jgi:hypothetical protein
MDIETVYGAWTIWIILSILVFCKWMIEGQIPLEAILVAISNTAIAIYGVRRTIKEKRY